MFRHILVPTDGSLLSTAAIEHGLGLARDTGAKITVLTVFEPFHVFSTDSEQIAETRLTWAQHVKEEAKRRLGDAERKAKALGINCEVLQVEDEHPYKAIIDTAQKGGCDLIAMASHGRSGVSAMVIGSETNKVLTHSAIPVLVYR
jgi:nucleotide-binding universal stress UspA family protein